MANVKKLKKELVKLGEEELKEVLEFLTEEEELEQEEKGEVAEEVVTKEKEEPKFATLDDINQLLEQFKQNFVPKEEVEKLKEDLDKNVKKAKPFGVEKSPDVPKGTQASKSAQELLAEINQRR